MCFVTHIRFGWKCVLPGWNPQTVWPVPSVLPLKVNKFREYNIKFVDPPADGMHVVVVGGTIGGGGR